MMLIPAVLMLAACSATPQAQSGQPTPTPRPVQLQLEKPTYTVQRGTVVDEVKVSGFVAALKQQELSFTQNGFLKVLYVDRTDVVTEGQLLAELDLGDLPNQLRQAEVALEQAQLQLDRNKAQRAFDQRRAQLDLEDAQARLRELQAPPDAQDLAAAQRAVADAQTALEETRTNSSAAKTQAELALREATNRIPALQVAYLQALEEWNDLKDKPNDWRHDQVKEAYLRAEAELRSAENAVTQAQVAYDTARQNEATAVRAAESALAAAQASLDDLNDGPDRDELAAAERALARAQVAVEEASQQGGDSELEGRVASATLEVERIQSQINAGQLYAAFAGRVSEIGARPGDSVEAYKAVVTVIDDSELELLVEGVTSQDANRIGLGQQVAITFSRAPGQTYEGVVTKLPTAATSSAATINPDRAYHIDFDVPDVALEVGDLAQVIVTLKRVDDALWLPPQAVRAFEGRRFVVVKDGDRQRRQDVRVGIVSLERVEILEGLNEGDIVVGQ
jgi:multidrug efflux pump subunit AcrA (membrane-fusion protein)